MKLEERLRTRWQDYYKEGYKKGYEEGLQKGMQEIITLLRQGYTLEQIEQIVAQKKAVNVDAADNK
jgi:flagellar biosynthesis/type III secretory pathway protein FliH